MNTATIKDKFCLHNSHFGAGIDSDGPMMVNARSRPAYTAFRDKNPDLAIPRPPSSPPTNASQVMITLGPIVSPRNHDRDFRAWELRANCSDIKALVNVQYHCGIEEAFDSLTLSIIAAVGYSNIGSDNIVACHNNIIEMHHCTVQLWHNPTANTFGPQVNRILEKSLKLFLVLDSTGTEDVVKFYDRFQEKASNHLLALMSFDAIMLCFGFEGLCYS